MPTRSLHYGQLLSQTCSVSFVSGAAQTYDKPVAPAADKETKAVLFSPGLSSPGMRTQEQTKLKILNCCAYVLLTTMTAVFSRNCSASHDNS